MRSPPQLQPTHPMHCSPHEPPLGGLVRGMHPLFTDPLMVRHPDACAVPVMRG